MSSRKKGFDPLSSLFEIPDPAVGDLLPDIDDEDGVGSSLPPVELTDPLFKAPPDVQRSTTGAPKAAVASPDPAAIARAVGRAAAERAAAEKLAEERAAANQADAVKAAPAAGPDPAAIARAVGRAAAQRAAAAAAKAAPASSSAVEAPSIPPLAMEPAPPQRQAPSGLAGDPIAIAKAIGKAAAERAAAAKPKPAPAPPAPKRAVAKKSVQSRLDSLASRAVRPRSALEIAREAARAEEQAREDHTAQEIRSNANELTDQVQALLPQVLPSVGAIYVANAIFADQRPVLIALWKAHRAKFVQEGQLERAVGAAAVLHALDRCGPQSLVAAHVVTDASDYLLWLDMGNHSLVAAFADARAFFAGAT